MAVTTAWYGVGFKNMVSGLANSVWDWDTDTIKVSLHTSTYALNVDADDFFNDVTNEVASANYTAGGVTLASTAVTYDSATNETRLSAATASWTTVSFTARYAVIYKSTGTASTSPLIAVVNFGADQTVSSGNFSITWDATGVIKAVS